MRVRVENLRAELAAFQRGADSANPSLNPFAHDSSEWFYFNTAALLAKRFDRPGINNRLRRLRLRVAKAIGRHTPQQWTTLVAEFGNRCVRCGLRCDRIFKDHIVPIYLGGSDGIENLQPLCERCNAAKGPECRNWAEYRRQNGFEVRRCAG